MREEFSRAGLLLGEKALDALERARVAVFGIGGVGSYVAEALARGGVGSLLLVDHDTVSVSNINRQLIALHSTVGRKKAEVMRERVLDINPVARVEARCDFYTKENADSFDFSGLSYIVDAIDTVSSKLLLVERANAAGIPILSCMGAGNKLDPTRFTVTDIYKTSVCPLARVMRSELRKRGIAALKVVYSTEEALSPAVSGEDAPPGKRQVPGSVSFVPSAAGLIAAGEVIRDLIREES